MTVYAIKSLCGIFVLIKVMNFYRYDNFMVPRILITSRKDLSSKKNDKNRLIDLITLNLISNLI